MSILSDVKVVCEIQKDDTSFDDSLIMHINGQLLSVVQIGVGTRGFIVDEASTWDDFLEAETKQYLEATKWFLGLKVKRAFDPPQTSYAINALNELITEAEWRLNSEVEYGFLDEETTEDV